MPASSQLRVGWGADLHVLWEDGDVLFCRGWRDRGDGTRAAVLVVIPAAEHPTPRTLERLAREYGLRDELDGTWAVRPLELVRDRGRTLLVLDDPGGEPVDQLLGSPLDLPTFLRLGSGIATALAGAHQRGLVHKDLKPGHILVERASGEVRLTGFGFASRVPREHAAAEPPEAIAGTLAYMAPEQTGRMSRSIDSRSDLYALGVVLYQMLTGDLPFTTLDPMELVHCHIARRPVPPVERVPGVPLPISAIVMKLLAKTAEDRYQTAAGVAADLRHCLADWERSAGSIEPFPLASHDVATVLRISEKLYGRDAEVGVLLAALKRVATRSVPEMVLVSGFAGIGKSSMVNELQKPPQALFLSAKCDQYRGDIPYATLTQALQTLVRQLLVKPDADVTLWRESVRNALGAHGRLVVDLVPELEILIGPQPPVPELPLREAENRVIAILGRFLAVFAQKEHPLVLFLDDLQWLDTATLTLLARIVSPPMTGALLVVGAYRDDEVGPDHPIMPMVTSVRKAGAEVHNIVLGPLIRDDLVQMVAESLGCEHPEAAPLGRLIHDKTAGNPFFANQFLATLCEEHLLIFDPSRSAWRWDIDEIRAKEFTDNVVQLMVGKLKRLPLSTQEALQRFACLGSSTGSETLAAVRTGSVAAVHSDLWDAVREGLVFRRGDSYRFLHGRVQEAAYALIPEDRRAAEHLRIGRLLSGMPGEAVGDRVFEVVNQLNRGMTLIADPAEREALRQLNVKAGRRAKNSAAYGSARGYLREASALLAADAWHTRYEDTFALSMDRCECEYLTGNFDIARDLSDLILENASSDLDRARVYRLRIRLSELAGQFVDALTALRDALRLFGTTLPESAADIQAASEAEHREVVRKLRGRRVAELVDAPTATDPTAQMIISLITESLFLASGWTVGHSYFPLITARGVNVALSHGHTAESSGLYEGYARARVDAGDFQSAFEFSDLALRLAEKFGDPRLQAIVLFRHGFFVNPWRNHVATSLPSLDAGFSALVKAGDFLYAGYAGVNAVELSLEKGDRLDHVLELSRKYADVIAQSQSNRYTNRLHQHFISCLKASPSEGTNVDGPSLSDTDRPAGIAGLRFHILRQIVSFLFGRYDEALESASRAAAVRRGTVTLPLVATYHFYRALTLAALYPRAAGAQRLEFRQTLGEELHRHRLWADNCRENFEHRYVLLAAEVARIDGQDLEAMRLYEAAIRSARKHGFIQNEALANELAGRFYLDRGLATNADSHLRDARACYALWGADGKVSQLDERYPQPAAPDRRPVRSGSPFQNLDVAALVRASQALSSEIVLPRLIETLMTIALQNAGADRGLLILPDAETYRIEAEARASGDHVEVGLSQAPITEGTCPEGLIRYVIRTRERMILEDAALPNLFSEDEYLRRHPPRSILCLPLIRQSRLAGLLYLENTLTSHAFAPDRIALLELMTAQAAISLENTRLYSDLQEREARIRRLVDSNIIGIVIWDFEIGIVEANDAFLDMLGYSRDDLVAGRISWTGMTPAEWRATDQQQLPPQMKAIGKSEPVEMEYVRRDGSRVSVLVGAATFEGRRNEGVAFVLDLTDRKRAEKALRHAQAELTHVTRVATLGELTASIAHEISQPLAAVVNNADACVRWLAAKNTEEAQQSAALVIADGHRAAEIVTRIRNLAKKAPPHREWVNINDAVREVIALARGEAQAHLVSVHTDLSGDLPLVLADRVQLQQVLLNLMMNAIEAMSGLPEGRRDLWVSSECVVAAEVVIAVRDSGPGLDPQSRDRLFDPFYTTKAHGMGMGLAISRSIVEAHGGRLWAAANIPRGAVFQFTVPIGTKRTA